MNLTTIARAKAYLQGVAGQLTAADALLAQLIARASDAAMNYTGRRFQRQTYTGLRLNGSGSARQMMPQNPIISVSSVAVDGVAYSESPDALQTGWQHDSKFLYLFGPGAVFCAGLRNVALDLVVGYSTTQTAFVPATTPYTITPVTGSGLSPDGNPQNTAGAAAVDQGVTYASTGNALESEAPGSNLSAGEYSFSDGTYTFAAADAGVSVVMAYDFIPGGVEEAVLQIIGTWMKRRSTLGVASETLGQQTVAYLDKDFPASAKALMNPYRYVVSP